MPLTNPPVYNSCNLLIFLNIIKNTNEVGKKFIAIFYKNYKNYYIKLCKLCNNLFTKLHNFCILKWWNLGNSYLQHPFIVRVKFVLTTLLIWFYISAYAKFKVTYTIISSVG